MSDCLACDGKGVLAGYACEVVCKSCGGYGVGPAWQAEAVAAGRALMEARRARDVSLMEEAKRLGIWPGDLSDAEHGRVPVSQWPAALAPKEVPMSDQHDSARDMRLIVLVIAAFIVGFLLGVANTP